MERIQDLETGTPTIAIVAHDAKKEELLGLLVDFLPKLADCQMVATQTTGTLVAQRLGLPVRLLQSGPMGGDQQVGALVAEGKLDAVVFLRDPLTAQPHEPDISALLRVCDVHNVPLATNRATARALLSQLFSGKCTRAAEGLPQGALRGKNQEVAAWN